MAGPFQLWWFVFFLHYLEGMCDMSKGLVERKKSYLGGMFPGQLLCWCRIDIGENAVGVYRHDGERTTCVRWVVDDGEVIALKAKLRRFVRKVGQDSRWYVERKPGVMCARMYIWYPSEYWNDGVIPARRVVGAQGPFLNSLV